MTTLSVVVVSKEVVRKKGTISPSLFLFISPSLSLALALSLSLDEISHKVHYAISINNSTKCLNVIVPL